MIPLSQDFPFAQMRHPAIVLFFLFHLFGAGVIGFMPLQTIQTEQIQPLSPSPSFDSSTLLARRSGFSSRIRPSRTSVGAVAKTGGKLIASAEEYEAAVIESKGPVMIFFTAPWCGPCRLSVPVVKEVMKEFSGRLEIVEVCTDDLPEVAADANVVSIPTIQIYSRGEVMDTIVGCVARSVLFSSVEKVLEDIAQKVGGAGSDNT